MPKKRTFYSEEERKAHHEKKQREADLQIQELTKHWENDPKDIAEYLAFSTQFYKYSSRNTMLIYRQRPDSVFIASYTHWKELGYYVQEGEHGAIVDLLHLNPQNGRSEAIEAALKFYFAYLSNQMNTDYLCGIYGRQVEAIVQRATDRISSQLFKQAVETNMLTRIVAFEYELSKDEYDKMRSKAVAAVKRSTGRISLFDTMQDSEE